VLRHHGREPSLPEVGSRLAFVEGTGASAGNRHAAGSVGRRYQHHGRAEDAPNNEEGFPAPTARYDPVAT
jgi:hypothetical protein